MNVGGVAANYPIGYEAIRTPSATFEKSFANTMGNGKCEQRARFYIALV